MTQLSYFSPATGSAIDSSVLRGVSVITEGPALGHGLQIDATTLAQVKTCAESFADGLRVKMDHGTGFSEMVGVLRSFRIDGTQLRADLHLIKSHADFSKIVEMSETMPGAFGLSIVFSGTPEVTGETRLARCLEIYSCDLVDQPAANPTGLFSKQTPPMENTPQTEPAAAEELSAEVMVGITVVASSETPEEEVAEQPEAEMVPELAAEPVTELPAELSSMVADFTALSSKLTLLEVQLAAKEAVVTELSNKLAATESALACVKAELSANTEAHARLSELHAAAKRSLGVMPAGIVPEVAIIAQEKTASDYRAEFNAIKDPTARAAFFAANQSHIFGN